jgi:hypothetical protein
MMRALLLVGAMGAAACSGNPGDPGDPGGTGEKGPMGDPTVSEAAIGQIVPHVGALAREIDVVITAQGMRLDQSPMIDFGQAIMVSNVTPASASAVFAHLTIGSGANIGLRDVKVTAGGKTATAARAFQVVPVLSVKITDGEAKQGSLVQLDLKNNDIIAFDTGETGGFPPFIPGSPNFILALEKGISLRRDFVSATDARFLALFDPLAPATQDVIAANAPGGAIIDLFRSDPLAIEKRLPTVLTAGTPLTGQSVGAPLASGYFKLTVPAAPSIVSYTIESVGTSLRPFILTYDKNGVIDQLFQFNSVTVAGTGATITYPVTATQNDGDMYVVLLDGVAGGAATGYGFTVNPTVTAATAIVEAGDAGATTATAQAVTAGELPAVISGEITTATDIDVFSVPLTAGQRLEVSLWRDFDGTARTAAALTGGQLINPADKTGRSVFTAPSTNTFHVNVRSLVGAPKAMGKYVFSMRILP